ncbi:MAG TPA: IS110 family transposase [Caulobacteraceae bacterium]|jgi:transposase|nr:IS110 family transposase [Caulobacteraceae bacterium]
MPHYVGLDAGKQSTSICIVDEKGAIVKEGSVPTEPRTIIGFLRGDGRRYARVGIEAMSMAAWLFEGLAKSGLPVICIEAQHAHNVLKSRLNKTDRNDARGIAEIMRAGLYKAVHIKTLSSQRSRLLLTVRRHLARKQRDIENLVRGALLQFGLKHQAGRPTTFHKRAEQLAAKSSETRELVAALLRVRAVVVAEVKSMDRTIAELAAADPVCVRLQTAPGVGPLTALTYRVAIDVPERFARSRDVGVHLGLTPRTYKSGAVDKKGRISKCGDKSARTALFLAAKIALGKRTRTSSLKTFGMKVAAARGYLRGVVATARRLAVVLHKMWVTGTDFRREPQAGMA